MTNHSRQIVPHLLDSPAPQPHKIITAPILLLSAAVATPSATANHPPPPYSDYTSPSSSIYIVFLGFTLLLIGFFSVFITRCLADDNAGATGLGGSAVVRLRRTAGGLNPEVIDSFPIFRYYEVKDLKIGKRSALECAVCISQFEDHETLRVIPKCHHVFHFECIDYWLTSHSTCPVCRADLVPTGSTHSVKILKSELGEAQNQSQNEISIDIEEDCNRVGKFLRSHSTGHSLSQVGDNCDRYTLRLPEEVRRQIVSRKLKRTMSSNSLDVLPSRERECRSDKWIFTMTPPFLARAAKSPKRRSVDGRLTTVGTPKLILRSPFNCLSVKRDGVGQIANRSCV